MTIYSLETFKKKKTLSTADCHSREYVSMAFSPDDKFLLTQGGAPDWACINWLFGRTQPKQITRIEGKDRNLGQKDHQLQCSFCPSDQSLICITGKNTLLYYRVEPSTLSFFVVFLLFLFFVIFVAGWLLLSFRLFLVNCKLIKLLLCTTVESSLKTVETSMGDRPIENYLCHTWLSGKKMVVGTTTGSILFYENTMFRAALKSAPEDGRIESMATFPGGFVVGQESGVIRVFEEDAAEYYRLTRTFHVHDHPHKVLWFFC